MGGGSSAVGGSDLCTAQESREEGVEEAGAARGSGGGGAMRARVCARVRTPQGVAALLLVGGAVVAWRRRRACRHDDGKGAKNHQLEQPVIEEVLDGGAVEDEQGSGNVEKVDKNSGQNDVENEITPNDTESVENSDQSTLGISSPKIAHEEHNNHDDGAEQIESTEITVIMERDVFEQEEEKALAELVDLVGSPAYSSLSSLLKRTENKGPANLGWNETGMKLEHDRTNGELSGAAATQGAAVKAMDHRTVSMAILALVFAVTIGIAVVMRLYAPLKAT